MIASSERPWTTFVLLSLRVFTRDHEEIEACLRPNVRGEGRGDMDSVDVLLVTLGGHVQLGYFPHNIPEYKKVERRHAWDGNRELAFDLFLVCCCSVRSEAVPVTRV